VIVPTSQLFSSKTNSQSGIKNGTANVVFSADTMAAMATASTPPINNFYIYRFGGFLQTKQHDCNYQTAPRFG